MFKSLLFACFLFFSLFTTQTWGIEISPEGVVTIDFEEFVGNSSTTTPIIRDLDLYDKTILVRKAKGGHERKVPILDRTIHWLNRYTNKVRPKQAKLVSGDALFLGETGKRILPSKLTDMVGRYMRRSVVADKGAGHLLRLSTATHMMNNGADIRKIQELLGILILVPLNFTRMFQ
ncbi:tyrosine-type recombinase/integrase [Colwelliaceae bacterium BS250]